MAELEHAIQAASMDDEVVNYEFEVTTQDARHQPSPMDPFFNIGETNTAQDFPSSADVGGENISAHELEEPLQISED